MGAPQQTSTLEFDTTSLGRLNRSRRRSVGRPGKAAPLLHMETATLASLVVGAASDVAPRIQLLLFFFPSWPFLSYFFRVSLVPLS